MPLRDNKFVCLSNFISETGQQVVDYENNNKDMQKPKIQ